MINILLLNSTVDHAFGFFRSLEKMKGYRFFWADSVKFAPAKSARCCTKVFRVPSVKTEPEYIDAIKKIITENDIHLLLPVGEYETKAVARYAAYLEETGVKIPIADYKDIELATDKLKLQEHCDDFGIPYSRTILVNDDHFINLDKLNLPVIIKQRSGTGQRGLRIISDSAELTQYVRNHLVSNISEAYIIQEFIPGYDHENMYSVGLLFNNGIIKKIVPLKKIRAQKFTGGTCTASCAVTDPALLSIAEKIGRSFPAWNGIMDIEFKKDRRTGEYVLIEINPRPWGCMFGAMTAGVDFPRLWIETSFDADSVSSDTVHDFTADISAAFLARDGLLFVQLIAEILFGKLKKQAISVLKTFKYPYFISSNDNRSYTKTSDFVLHDIKPFLTNILRQVYSK